jgi:hypothetical protein
VGPGRAGHRYTTPNTDAELAQELPGHTAHQIKAPAKDHRVRTKRDAQRTHAQTAFRSRRDKDNDGYR